ncbi:MAG: Signal transduction histidine-protein kinase BaeS [Firmicutes bacterium ADurb.Bin099]|nr:MAG: Signal transduction histidine-protein kinase BaeS [Firmicutes bacterium ADurb.Bin099]
MRNKITKKLLLYFLIIVLANSLISSGIFVVLGQKVYMDAYKEYLARRAENIAQAISDNMDIFADAAEEEATTPGRGKRQGGKNNPNARVQPKYIDWMDQVLEGKVWLIYKEDKIFQRGNSDIALSYDDLTDYEKAAIDKAFEGKTVTSESFDNIFDKGTLSAVAPLKDSDGSIYGAILIHEDIAIARRFIDSAFYVLMVSGLVGIFIVLIMIIIFVRKFIRPINRIDSAAKVMIDGDYQVRTGVNQDDEIGDLAKNMDELAVRLERGRKESENIDRMRNDFISSMSHELKTPVTVMKASLEGLVSGIIPESEIENYHKILYEEIGVLDRLVMDLMELNAVRNKSFPMNFKEEDLISVLKDAARSQRVLADKKGVEIILNIKDSYYMFSCDYTRLRQMFITVINNGIKYSDADEQVIIRQFRDRNFIKIQVINKGNAIDSKDKEHIFEAFYRGKNTSEKGFGLGLAIAKEIANRHAIHLHVFSESERETVFEFVLQ